MATDMQEFGCESRASGTCVFLYLNSWPQRQNLDCSNLLGFGDLSENPQSFLKASQQSSPPKGISGPPKTARDTYMDSFPSPSRLLQDSLRTKLMDPRMTHAFQNRRQAYGEIPKWPPSGPPAWTPKPQVNH